MAGCVLPGARVMLASAEKVDAGKADSCPRELFVMTTPQPDSKWYLLATRNSYAINPPIHGRDFPIWPMAFGIWDRVFETDYWSHFGNFGKSFRDTPKETWSIVAKVAIFKAISRLALEGLVTVGPFSEPLRYRQI